MEKRIRLTESDLHRIVKESMDKVLIENDFDEICRSLYTFNDYVSEIENAVGMITRPYEIDEYKDYYNEIINNFVSNNNLQDFYDEEYDDIDEDKLRDELASEFETDIYGED